jgi:hypothetical protein
MKLTTVRINSYFGDNPELQKIRIEAHKKQLDFWQSRGYKIVVYAYRYEDEWFEPNVRYITTPPDKKVLIAAARNILLEDFYNSNEDFSFFLDNDAILYADKQHLDGNDFLTVFNKTDINDLNHVDCFGPVDPRQLPFSEFNKRNADMLSDNLYFELIPGIKGTMFCLKNLNKFYGKKIFMDDERFPVGQGEVVASEDRHFAANLLWNGFGNYLCRNIILKEIVPDNSTWLPDTMTRGESVSRDTPFYRIMREDFGLTMKKNNLDYTKLYMKSQKPKDSYVRKNPGEGFFYE